MPETQHTPGPWKLVEKHTVCSSKQSAALCYIVFSPERTPQESEANAKLMAAVPELLVALQRLCNTCDTAKSFQIKGGFREQVLADAKAAIKKATE